MHAAVHTPGVCRTLDASHVTLVATSSSLATNPVRVRSISAATQESVRQVGTGLGVGLGVGDGAADVAGGDGVAGAPGAVVPVPAQPDRAATARAVVRINVRLRFMDSGCAIGEGRYQGGRIEPVS